MIAPLALIGLYFTPKEVFGCANRGYMALALVLGAALAALAATIKGVREKSRGNAKAAQWWMITTLILLLPVLLLLGPLG
jgi:uncharacterized membrane protein YiaA